MPVTLRGTTLRNTTYMSQWTPQQLFSSGEQGVWFDPSDMSTMSQDSSGTTPVTGYEQPVGLMLDKSKGLVLGSELISNAGPNFAATTGWVANGTTLSIVDGKLRATLLGAYGGAYIAFATVAGKSYRVTFSLPSTANGRFGTAPSNSDLLNPTSGIVSAVIRATGTTSYFSFFDNTGASSGTVDLAYVSVREVPGNHAFQGTSASRPVLSARYNLFSNTEDFSNAYWTKENSSILTNQEIAPDGTNTVDHFVVSPGNNYHTIYVQPNLTGTFTFSLWARKIDLDFIRFSFHLG